MFVTDAHLQISKYLHDHNPVLVDVQFIIECVEVVTDPEHGVELPDGGPGADQGHQAGAGQETEHAPGVTRSHQALLPPGPGVWTQQRGDPDKSGVTGAGVT